MPRGERTHHGAAPSKRIRYKKLPLHRPSTSATTSVATMRERASERSDRVSHLVVTVGSQCRTMRISSLSAMHYPDHQALGAPGELELEVARGCFSSIPLAKVPTKRYWQFVIELGSNFECTRTWSKTMQICCLLPSSLTLF